jgi:hypothetical protein
MQHYDHAMLGAILSMAAGAHRRFGAAIVVTAIAAAALPDWDDLPGGVHRVWGHSLLVAPMASGLVGAVGYLAYVSLRRPTAAPASGHAGHDLAVWILVGVLASLSHVLTDLAYSGRGLAPEWPVALLWPVSDRRWAWPLVPFADRGLTVILAVALATVVLRPGRARLLSAMAMVATVGYVALWAVAAVLAR